MQTVVLEGTDRETLRDKALRLWDDLRITGEMGLRPLEGGRWRLEVVSERELDEAELSKFGPVKVTA